MKPIRCIECYKQRPGGRCEWCPLHKKNRSQYRELEDGWFIPIDQDEDHLMGTEVKPKNKSEEEK